MEVSIPVSDGLTVPVLQWGHDKIVMEVSCELRDTINEITLQWGHDKIVMEVAVTVGTEFGDMGASMGP